MLKHVLKEPAALSDAHMNLNPLQPNSTWKISHKKKKKKNAPIREQDQR